VHFGADEPSPLRLIRHATSLSSSTKKYQMAILWENKRDKLLRHRAYPLYTGCMLDSTRKARRKKTLTVVAISVLLDG
jgi:hypothetical protein